MAVSGFQHHFGHSNFHHLLDCVRVHVSIHLSQAGQRRGRRPKRETMKIWVDDIRTPPDNTWIWAKTSHEAIVLLTLSHVNDLDIEAMSLDHDLGGDDTSRRIVL